MKKIYAVAQHFGFGPTANLLNILKSIKSKTNQFKICVVQSENIKILSQNNSSFIDEHVDDINFKNADLILSSFDAFSIIKAWANNIPCIYYCNLFWYWDVFNKKQKIIKYMRIFTKLKKLQRIQKIYTIFQAIFKRDPHEGIFLGFIFANQAFTRKFPDIEKFITLYNDLMQMKLFDIYMPFKLEKKHTPKTTILFQLAGSKNPIVHLKENIIYAKLCIALVNLLANEFLELNFTICINPHILKYLPFTAKYNIQLISSVSPEKNFYMLNEALAVFISPGLESIYEAIYTECPIFLLPEQNAGQYSIFKMLNNNGFKPDRYLINEKFPNRLKIRGEDDAHEIYKIINQHILNNPLTLKKIHELASIFIKKIKNKKIRNNYLKMSLSSLQTAQTPNPFTNQEIVSDYIIENFI